MAANKLGLRKLWFQVHKWLGITLAVLVIPLSLTGSALVWHDWLDETVNPQRSIPGNGEAALAPSAYVKAAQVKLVGGERPSSLRFEENHAAVMSAVRPAKLQPAAGRPPERSNVWMDPANARVLDSGGSNAGLVRTLHVLHGSLMVPGVGRQIVGWLGVAMLLSSLTGLWLWWPTIGKFTNGLRWRRGNDTYTNLHHQTGFWVCIPLAMLSFTGVWISFPAFFAVLSGSTPPNPAERAARMRAQPLAVTKMTVDEAVAQARGGSGVRLVSVNWPTDMAPEWRISIAGAAKPSEVTIIDATGAIKPARGPSGGGQSGIARTMRQWHDGSGMGLIWQIVIFIGGIIPAILAVTGLVMWWRTRGWRAGVTRRINDRQAT